MNRSAMGWSVKRFERSNRLDAALYKNLLFEKNCGIVLEGQFCFNAFVKLGGFVVVVVSVAWFRDCDLPLNGKVDWECNNVFLQALCIIFILFWQVGGVAWFRHCYRPVREKHDVDGGHQPQDHAHEHRAGRHVRDVQRGTLGRLPRRVLQETHRRDCPHQVSRVAKTTLSVECGLTLPSTVNLA